MNDKLGVFLTCIILFGTVASAAISGYDRGHLDSWYYFDALIAAPAADVFCVVGIADSGIPVYHQTDLLKEDRDGMTVNWKMCTANKGVDRVPCKVWLPMQELGHLIYQKVNVTLLCEDGTIAVKTITLDPPREATSFITPFALWLKGSDFAGLTVIAIIVIVVFTFIWILTGGKR